MISAFLLNYPYITPIIHFLFAILLFILINWIGKNSLSVGYMQMNVVIQEDTAPAFNFLFKALGPVVYLILCVVIFQSLKLDNLVDRCYFIVIDYWIFRLLWNLLSNRWKLINWGQQILYWLTSIGIAVWFYNKIGEVNNILPSGQGLVDQMWILIIAFLYAVFNQVKTGNTKTIKRKNSYIESRYKKFHAEYNDIIHSYFHNKFYEALTYSIMVYEDFNRPFMIRIAEYISFFFCRKRPHSLGIMQVMTTNYIDDKQSVKLAIQKIANDANSYLEQTPQEDLNASLLLYHIAEQYNGGDPNYA